MPPNKDPISVWFFIGLLLTIYGILILGAGIYEFGSPPPVVLAELHTPIWWGALLLILGLVYVYLFNPARTRVRLSQKSKKL